MKSLHGPLHAGVQVEKIVTVKHLNLQALLFEAKLKRLVIRKSPCYPQGQVLKK